VRLIPRNDIVNAVVQGINARRSAVTKNALVCVGDMMRSLRTQMDDHIALFVHH